MNPVQMKLCDTWLEEKAQDRFKDSVWVGKNTNIADVERWIRMLRDEVTRVSSVWNNLFNKMFGKRREAEEVPIEAANTTFVQPVQEVNESDALRQRDNYLILYAQAKRNVELLRRKNAWLWHKINNVPIKPERKEGEYSDTERLNICIRGQISQDADGQWNFAVNGLLFSGFGSAQEVLDTAIRYEHSWNVSVVKDEEIPF